MARIVTRVEVYLPPEIRGITEDSFWTYLMWSEYSPSDTSHYP